MIVEHLIADTFGTHIGKHSERLIVSKGGDKLTQAPLLHLRAVWVLNRGVSISADAIEVCCERGIPICFISSRGEVYATLHAAGLGGTVLTRRAQILAYQDVRSVAFVRAITEAKIHNQAANIKYLAKTRAETAPQVAEELRLCAGEVLDMLATLDRIDGGTVDDVRGSIMGVEGSAGKRYWSAIRAVLPVEYGWPGRVGRGATDPINSLLNYGYGVLYGQVEQAIVLAGLDPFAGFLHADRPGKPSLTLDLIEEFRQVAVDRVVFGLVNRHFTVSQDAQGRLAEDVRRNLAEKVLAHLETEIRYEGKRYPIRFVLQNQARNLAAFLRGDRDSYIGYKATY
jgi:CRISPR-associated protein Cas1